MLDQLQPCGRRPFIEWPEELSPGNDLAVRQRLSQGLNLRPLGYFAGGVVELEFQLFELGDPVQQGHPGCPESLGNTLT